MMPDVQVPTLAQIRKRLDDPVHKRAMELHRQVRPNGCWPCWGPTLAELEQARTELGGGTDG